MSAVRLTESGRLEITEIEEIHAPRDGIVLKTEACGLTDTDLKVLRGELAPDTEFLGSQIAGIVKEAGEDADGYEAGDRILVSCYQPCGICRSCRGGRANECSERKTFGFHRPGGLSGELSLSGADLERAYILKLPGNLKFEEACAADTAAAVFHSHSLCGIGPGKRILVLGCGPAGCMHTHLAKLRGADVIIQADVNAVRMEMSRPFMADYLLNTAVDNLEETVREVTGGRGADIVIVAADAPEALSQAVENVAEGGKILLFSRFGKKGETVSLNISEVQKKQLQIIASDGYTKEEIQEILWLAGKRKITLKWLVTSVIPPEEIEKKAEEAANGKELRIVVHP